MNSGELNLKFVYDVENRITQEGLKNSSTQIVPARCVLIGLAGQGKTRGTAAYNLIERKKNFRCSLFRSMAKSDNGLRLPLSGHTKIIYDFIFAKKRRGNAMPTMTLS